MEFIAHRINTVAQLREVPPEYGVEIDLRDRGERLILQHDPFSDGEDFAEYLPHYHHGTLILNIKSERIEHRVLELLNQHGVEDYFFLDSSFPMLYLLARQGEQRVAVRFSELKELILSWPLPEKSVGSGSTVSPDCRLPGKMLPF
jgi:hypothetical protein